jgi:hypothetical protein
MVELSTQHQSLDYLAVLGRQTIQVCNQVALKAVDTSVTNDTNSRQA